MADTSLPSLLAAEEPPAYEWVNAASASPVLLVCDHASNRVPRALGDLGVGEADRSRHIGWDIGAAEVTRLLAARFDAPAILTGYSRLVIDCNRDPSDPSAMPQMADGTPVPGNEALSGSDRQRRIDTLFRPYQAEIAARVAAIRANGQMPVLLAIHSFTPVFKGAERPWHLGILWNKDDRIAGPLMETLRADPALCIGDNQPYSAREPEGFTLEHHAEPAGLPHVLVEIRQDLISDPEGVQRWAGILGDALAAILNDPALNHIFQDSQ
ncbi:MAG: N-formylglutamate amidohydrolase [Alphaproteobacteria bacterium]|nr:N-formylglutamate amidohydrolase [Alphaproteobacteria bacterium]MBU0796198.1 N-formylglutamate amidohydrolase [Alphaproteobacteria bacterium]MBU0888454.1 N-formylglutamate amidohydrolase [Alphaproteobacteria bacterium]MBU1813083.1 N-formylglutamate amidohydrolase [Alphaproteobacteria bacterium]MBU2090397.1 N-formylglutamate amidohydrolase [Alphaproteobacteria bacterium]